jgi:hypothetical protein
MTVPKTTMYEDYFALSGENQVWLAGKLRIMEPIAKARAVQ